MKKIMMVLPLAVLLAYCSGPNNTQTSTGTDMDNTSVSTSTTNTTTTDMATSTDVSDVNTNTTTVSGTTSGTNTTNSNSTNYGSISTTGTTTMDLSDPMVQHFERVNKGSWTWDMSYPGFDRPTAGTYNSAINGNWQLVMTPELVSAWRQDNSRSLWSSGYAYDGRFLGGNTYLSASETFNTRNNSTMGTNTQGSLQVNGSLNAGTVSSNNTSASTSGLNNNASANSSTANQMNGSTSTSTSGVATNNIANPSVNGTTGSSTTTGTVNGSAGVSGNSTLATNNNANPSLNGSVNGSVSGTTGSSSTLNNGSTDLNGTTTLNSSMDVNSVNYNAANGNMYQLPKFNLFLDNGSFTGYTGCNSISGRVAVMGTSLHFLNTTPSTNIDCMGGLDQNVFLDMLRRVDSYAYVGDELQLLQGNQVLLRFKKGDSSTSLH